MAGGDHLVLGRYPVRLGGEVEGGVLCFDRPGATERRKILNFGFLGSGGGGEGRGFREIGDFFFLSLLRLRDKGFKELCVKKSWGAAGLRGFSLYIFRLSQGKVLSGLYISFSLYLSQISMGRLSSLFSRIYTQVKTFFPSSRPPFKGKAISEMSVSPMVWARVS